MCSVWLRVVRLDLSVSSVGWAGARREQRAAPRLKKFRVSRGAHDLGMAISALEARQGTSLKTERGSCHVLGTTAGASKLDPRFEREPRRLL